MRSISARSTLRAGAALAGLVALAAIAGCASSGQSVSVASKPISVRSAEARIVKDGRVMGRVCRSVEVVSPRDYDVAIVLRDAQGRVVARSQAAAQGFAGRPHLPNCAGFAAKVDAQAAQAATIELTIRDPRQS